MFKTIGKKLKNCKYGFRFDLNDEEQLDPSGVRYLYIRRKEEDRDVSPYNPYILLFMQCHVNYQKVSNSGWEKYLAKYISKAEPNQKIQIDKNSNTQNYLQMRIIGSFEASIIALNIRQISSSLKVEYLPTTLDNKYIYMKRLKDMPKDPSSNDIYYKSKFEKYLERPKELHDLNYPDFFRRFQYVKCAKSYDTMTEEATEEHFSSDSDICQENSSNESSDDDYYDDESQSVNIDTQNTKG